MQNDVVLLDVVLVAEVGNLLDVEAVVVVSVAVYVVGDLHNRLFRHSVAKYVGSRHF